MLTDIAAESFLRPDDYLGANVDVRMAGMDPLEHYRQYGRAEGRKQLTGAARIKELREEKLKRVQFKHPPVTAGEVGAPRDYIPDDIRKSFELPDFIPIAENDYNSEIIDTIKKNPGKLFLDVGAGFRHTYYSNVVNAEIWPARSTDVMCVGESLPFEDAQFDYIFCLAVLEHTKRPWIAVEEMLRVLKPGGHVRIDWPFLQPFHGYPYHFYNATSKGTESLFEDQCDIISSEVKPWQHPIFSLTWILQEWNSGLSEAERPDFHRLTVADLLSKSSAAMLGDRFCSELPVATREIISAGTTLIARKR